MDYTTANRLAEEIRNSPEYLTYLEAKAILEENETASSMMKEYHRLQILLQAQSVSGSPDPETVQKLKKLAELLQFDETASRYLMAEYQVHTILSDVYKILADAVGVDLSYLEG